MRRREFITLIGGTAATHTLSLRSSKVRRMQWPAKCQEETLDGTQGRKLGAVSRESAFWRKATRVRTGPRFRP